MRPEHETLSDEALLKSFISGEDTAFDSLMTRHEDRIFTLALRMTGDRADALDATQDAFLAAYRQAASFRGESAFGTWLYRIAINACKDLIRKRRRLQPSEEPPEPEDRAGSESVAEAASLRIDVARALERLSEEYREAVVLHDLGGVPYEEIARITGANLGTVKSRISRGRKKLAEFLEPHARTLTSKEAT